MSWMPDVLDPEDDHVREVYAHAGLALYMAQVLEHGLANVIVFARARSPEFHSVQDYEDALDDLLRKTMGQQLRRALGLIDFTENQVAALEDALRWRNFLVHDFFRERIGDFASAAGKNKMIAELDEMRDRFKAIDEQVQELTYAFAAKHGITREMWQAEMEAARAEHAEHADPE